MAKGKIVPLVTRDLTPTWRRKKAERKRSHGPGYPGSQPLLQEEETTSRVDRSSLPPEWVDHAERADEELKEIKKQIDHLAKAQQRRLELPEKHHDTRAREQDVEAVSSHVSTLIRCCEQTIHQIRAVGKKEGLLDDEFRQNMQRNLASQLQQVSKLCREQQKTYMAELKRKSSGPSAVPEASNPDPMLGATASGGVQMQEQLTELDEMEVIAAQRSSEIAQIASSVVELNRIFKDLASLVIDQGTVLDRIDFNTEKIYQRSDEAKGQLHQAVKRKKESDSRAWKCLLVWGAADLILLIVLLVKYQLKYGLKNVAMFLVAIALILTVCYFGVKQYKPKVITEGPAYFEKVIPEGWRPDDIWKKIRPGPVNSAFMCYKVCH